MLGTRSIYSLALALLLTGAAFAQNSQRPYPPVIEGADVQTYKQASGADLNLWIFTPDGHSASDRRPAMVFFFGGGWRGGSPQQFVHQAQYLASRGMVAILADYRVASRHRVQVVSCVEDAKSAIRWVRERAAQLGVDPERIAAAGGSAGGHLAAATGTVADFDLKEENHSVSSVPNAMVLFNPALVLAPDESLPAEWNKRMASSDLSKRLGAEPAKLSPYHQVRKNAPPAIIFHGKADTTVPYRSAEVFTEKMKRLGNRCELVGYDGEPHGFFNYGKGDGSAYIDTTRRTDSFLASLGWLEGEPTIAP